MLGIRDLLETDHLDTSLEHPVSEMLDSPIYNMPDFDTFLYSKALNIPEMAVVVLPSKAEIFALLDIYTQRVDPILKVTHVPSLRTLLLDVSTTTYSQEALRFSVYFSATCALTDAECFEIMDAGRSETMARFRRGAEDSFSKADLLTTQDWTVLQAFTVYLVRV